MKKVKRGSLKPDQSSLVIHIIPVLQSRNIKHPTAFLRRLGISPGSVAKILKGEASQLNLNQITKICIHLNCEPNDLFARRDLHLPKEHQLLNLPEYKPVPDMLTVDEFLGKKSVGEVRGMLRR